MKKVININNNIHIDTYLRPGNNTTINAGKHTITSDKGVIINDPTAASFTQTLKILQSTAASGRILPPVD